MNTDVAICESVPTTVPAERRSGPCLSRSGCRIPVRSPSRSRNRKPWAADQRTALRSTASCRRPMAPGRSFTSNSQKIAIRTTTHPK
jgi:hypothetical protein